MKRRDEERKVSKGTTARKGRKKGRRKASKDRRTEGRREGDKSTRQNKRCKWKRQNPWRDDSLFSEMNVCLTNSLVHRLKCTVTV